MSQRAAISLILAITVWKFSAQDFVGDHPVAIFNSEGSEVVVVLHGLNPGPPHWRAYYPLATKLASLGYSVVVPKDCEGAKLEQVVYATTWGVSVALAARDSYANGRPVAVIGHSLGGMATISAAMNVPGIAAFAVMHPATFFTPQLLQRASGPILFTTGTRDSGVTWHATAPERARGAYSWAAYPKALVNVRGSVHTSPMRNLGGIEFEALEKWLGCWLRKDGASCEWLTSTMCQSAALEWCEVDLRSAGIFSSLGPLSLAILMLNICMPTYVLWKIRGRRRTVTAWSAFRRNGSGTDELETLKDDSYDKDVEKSPA